MQRPVDFSVPLSIDEAGLLVKALTTQVATWRRHYEEDGGRTHTPDAWNEVRTQSGELIWRLEEAAVLPGQLVEHSEYAVRPRDDDEDGGAGVREPRRPTPPTPSAREYKG